MRRLLHALPPLALAAVVLAVAALPEPSAGPPPTPPSPAADTMTLQTVALPAPPADTGNPPDPPKVAPAPHPVPAPPAVPVVRPSRSDAGRGRLMLDRIEKGEGPSIRIAWPDERAARRRLVVHLERCADWRVLLLADGRLWRLEERPGEPWSPPSAAAPSGLLRDLDGPAADAAIGEAIRRRHSLPGGRPVAAVSRSWDARLLGGLDRLTRGAGTGDIRARYAIDGGRLTVTDVRVSGQPVLGRVDLGPVSRCGG